MCQDYASALSREDHCIAIVSDGCSGSKHSDFGSRLITQASLLRSDLMAQWLRGVIPADDFGDRVVHLASEWAQELSLPRHSLDATLVAACCHEGMVGVYVAGDGHYILVHPDRSFSVHVLSYTEPYPNYLSYALDKSAMEQREDMCVRYTLTTHHYTRDGELVETNAQALADRPHTMLMPVTMLHAVIVGSDGLDTLVQFNDPLKLKHSQRVPNREVYADMFCFKNYQGEFIKRRMNRFFQDSRKTGRAFTDDVALAGFSFREAEGS